MNDPLAHQPFSFRIVKDERVQIFYRDRLVTTLGARDGSKLIGKFESLSAAARQQLMARATGQFKTGNEKL